MSLLNKDNKTEMTNLNPNTSQDESVWKGVFPPTLSYYNDLFCLESFTSLLMTNVFETDGMTMVAKYFSVEDK